MTSLRFDDRRCAPMTGDGRRHFVMAAAPAAPSFRHFL